MPSRPPTFGARRRAKRVGGSAALRDRSAAYARQRERILTEHPLCAYCRIDGLITPATILDHILALSLGGTNDPANLCPACKPCNDAKALDERRCASRGYREREARMDPAMREWFRKAQR